MNDGENEGTIKLAFEDGDLTSKDVSASIEARVRSDAPSSSNLVFKSRIQPIRSSKASANRALTRA